MTEPPWPVLTVAMPTLPLWVRALRNLDRAAWYAAKAHQIARDELLFALLSPDLRADLTVLAYSDTRSYLPGGSTFEEGLFSWEKMLLEQQLIPRSGRVLLAAAGGGRELKALAEAGYAISAFEPNRVLFEGAAKVGRTFRSVEVYRAQYSDLDGAARGDGPLAELNGIAFDWVLLGWGSFTHLTERSAQLRALASVRALAPRAPVALSFYLRKSEEVAGKSEDLRRFLRKALRRFGAKRAIEPGLGYGYIGGFVYSFTREEFVELASLAGYRVAFEDSDAFPCAILVPK